MELILEEGSGNNDGDQLKKDSISVMDKRKGPRGNRAGAQGNGVNRFPVSPCG